MFNIFINLIDPNYLSKVLDSTDKEKAFMAKVPEQCASRMLPLLPSQSKTSPTPESSVHHSV